MPEKLNFQINGIQWKVWLEILSNCVSFEEMSVLLASESHLTLGLPGGEGEAVYSCGVF